MKKFSLIAILLIPIFAFNIYALSLDELVKRAKSESSVYEDTINQAKRSDYSATLLTLDKEHSFSIGVQSGKWEPKNNNKNEITSNVSFTPYFSYSSADDNTTSITVSSPVAIKYDDTGVFDTSTYDPKLNIDQKILLNGVKDSRLDYQKKLARLEADSTLKKAEFQYENTLYNTIQSVLSKQSSYLKSTSTYNERKALFDSNVSSGIIDEGTYAYKKERSSIESLYNEMIVSESALTNAMTEFKRVAGFEWEGIEEIQKITPEFEEIQDGNTEIQVSKINMDNAKNEYEILLKNDDRVFTLNANAGTSIKGSSMANWNIGAGVRYKDNNFNASVSALGDFSSANNWKGDPTLAFEASYSVGSNTDETKRLKIQNALLNLQSKTYEYNNALINYRTSALSMKTNIEGKILKEKEALLTYENAKDDYENVKDLDTKGYYTPLSIKTEEAIFIEKENAYKSSLLDLYIINNDAKILNV